jgi:hypothetical protein
MIFTYIFETRKLDFFSVLAGFSKRKKNIHVSWWC